MKLPRIFTKEVLIRLREDGTWVSTAKYGCFYSKSEVIELAGQPSVADSTKMPATRQQRSSPFARGD
jgi:hypothetical protein